MYSLAEYHKPLTYNPVLVKLNATTNDIIYHIVKVCNCEISINQSTKTANNIQSKTNRVNEISCILFDLVKQNIPFKADIGDQFLPSPNHVWNSRYVELGGTGMGCDAKGYSIFISSILYNLSIHHFLRFVAVKDALNYNHVYVVVKDVDKIIVIDPLMNNVNEECSYSIKMDKAIY